MATSIGPRIGIEGESEYRRQIGLIIQQTKTLASEMQAVTSSFNKNTTAQEKDAATGKVLQKQIEAQREQVKLLSDMLQKSTEKTGENSTQTLKWQEAVNKATAELNRMENGLDDAGDSAFTFGDALRANVLAQAIVDGIKQLASAVKDMAKDFVNSAAEVKAETSQFEQTFGDMGDQASAAIQRVADESGILSTRLNAAGTGIYAFARASGADAAQGLDLMERGLQAAADAAAYYDRSLDDTVGQLQSFLKGNYANDAALGLSATETTRNAAAMELFGEKFNDLTEVQKQQTLLQMVLDAQELSGAMGQAAREAEGWENVQGNLNEAWRQFEAKAGAPFLEALIPIIKGITDGMQGWTQKVDWGKFSANITNFVDTLVKNKDIILAVIAGVGAGFVAWNVVSMIMGLVTAIQAFRKANEGASIAQAALNAVMSANPIAIIITLIAGLVAALVTLFATNEDFRENVLSIGQDILDFVSAGVSAVKGFFTETLPQEFQQFDEYLSNVFAKDWTEVFGPVLGGAVNGFFRSVSDTWAGTKRTFNGILEFIKGVFTGDWSRAWQGVVDIFGGIFDGITAVAKTPINALIGLLNGAIGAINSLINGFNSIGFTMPKWLGGGSWHPNLPNIPSIPYLAKGGTVRSGYAIVGEAGPELLSVGASGTRVQPLAAGERARGIDFGGITINVYGHEGQDENAIADAVASKLQSMVARREVVWQ